MNDAQKQYIERLTEAELNGEPLPEAQSDEERQSLEQFRQTSAIFAELQNTKLVDEWQGEVWARIDEALESETGDGADEESGDIAPRNDADDKKDLHDKVDNVIDASARFRRVSVYGALIAAAAALLLVFAVKLAPMADVGEPAPAMKADVAMPEGSPAASGAREQDSRGTLLAKNLEMDEAEESVEAAMPAEVAPTSGNYGLRKEKFDAPMKMKKSADKGGFEGGEGYRNDMDGAGGKAEEAAEPTAADSTIVAGSPPKDAEKPGDDWGRGLMQSGKLQERPRMTAGEVDDNADFEGFQSFLRERNKPQLEPVDVSERLFVRILDADNRPLPNTEVDFKVGQQVVFTGKTYSDGWTLFHPRSVPLAAQATSFDLEVRSGPLRSQYTIERGSKERFEFRVPVQRVLPARAQLDLVFLLDTTSSMADEIERLQQTIIGISDDVSKLASNPEVRFGLVLYRDDSDEYISKVYPFESEVAVFQQTLAQVNASGGGDLPERLEVGLHRSINELAWRPDATRLVFLVADASPHGRDQNEFSYSHDAMVAASKAIKVYPVASSGLSDDGEYVFRQIAQLTMARFIFLTYGASGTETPHDIVPGSFQPETLDALIVRIVREELAGLERE